MLKRLALFFLAGTLAFGEEERAVNPLLLQIQSLNFQAGKEVINLSNETEVRQTKAEVKPEEFERTEYDEYVKPYSEALSKKASAELTTLLDESGDFIAAYRANQIYLTLLAYQTDEDLRTLIKTVQTDAGNFPTAGKELKVAWISPDTPQNAATKTTDDNANQTSSPNTQLEVEGYCAFTRTIQVYSKPFYVKTVCFFNDERVSRGYLFGQVVPDLEQREVRFKPIMFEDPGGNKYAVETILVLNGEQTSPNVATSVNERELERALATATKNAMADTKEMLKEYFKGEGTTVTVNGDVIIEQRDYSLINVGEFAFRNFLASLVEAGAGVFEKKLEEVPVIFTIEKGTTVYVRLLLKPLEK